MSAPPGMIFGPKRDGGYPGREIDCQESISARLVELIDIAKNADWTALEVTRAIRNLSDDLLLGLENELPEN